MWDRFVILLTRHLQVAILSPMLLREAPGKFTFAAIPACIMGVYLIARPQMEMDHHKAHLHLAGIIVGLFQVGRLCNVSLCAVCVVSISMLSNFVRRWPRSRSRHHFRAHIRSFEPIAAHSLCCVALSLAELRALVAWIFIFCINRCNSQMILLARSQ